MEQLRSNSSDREAQKELLSELALDYSDLESADILEELNRKFLEGEE